MRSHHRHPQQYHEHQRTHDQDATSESGILYLVPSKSGPGKTIVRRPRPPPTSTPLDEDFDAFTQGGTTTQAWTPDDEYQRERSRTSTRRRRGQQSDVTGSSSPMKPDFDAVTNTYVGTSPISNSRSATKDLDHEPSLRHGSWERVLPRRTRPVGGIGGGGAEYGIGNGHNRPDDGFEGYGEYGQYINEMEHMFGHGGREEVKLSLAQLGHGLERAESRQVGHGSTKPLGPRSSAALIRVGTGRIGRPSRLGSVVRNGDGPKAGQDYEMINRKVVEDGPERTVTISTWREQVANETRTVQEGELDVYYVGAEDYANEDEVHQDEGRTDLDNDSRRRRVATPSERRKGSISGGPSSSGGKTNERGKHPSSEGRYSSRHAQGSDKMDRLTQGRGSSSRKSGQTHHSHSLSEEVIRSPNYFSSRSTSPPPRSWKQASASPARTVSPNRDDTVSKPSHGSPLGSIDGLEGTPPRSSTPVRRLPESPPQQTPTPSRGSTPYRAVAPRDRELPPEPEPEPEPFHPTQSGSTISTIKSSSVVALESVLASCEPSLLHISPVLAKLGIVTEGHLRAVARLTEETRDREVKDEALRQGVTVMEWAILLDRLQAL